MSDPEQEDIHAYASPPCFMHELHADFGQEAVRADSWSDVSRWRKAERQRLIAERVALNADERTLRSARLAANLDAAIGEVSGQIVSSYWPFRGEPDLRNWAIKVSERGGRIALPVVIDKDAPLEFRVWGPDDPLERGVWNILVPSRGPAVLPDIVIAPMAEASSTVPWRLCLVCRARSASALPPRAFRRYTHSRTISPWT